MPKPLVAIVGRPNVGKSSLFNRLVGKRQALVEDVPGITRDRLYGQADWDGVDFQLLDTGGFDDGKKNEIAQKINEQCLIGVDEASVVIFLMDARSGLHPVDKSLIAKIRKLNKKVIYVLNKVDHQKVEEDLSGFYELGLDDFYCVSAETGRKVGDMLDGLVRALKEVKVEGHDEDIPEEAIKVALVGKPNVGKSSLLNALIGKPRSLVAKVKGTTRDPIHTLITHQDFDFCLIDTAGIRKRSQVKQKIETYSIIKSLHTIEKSDYVLALLDGDKGVSEQDAHIIGKAFELGKAILFLVNKWDLGADKGNTDDFKEQIAQKLHFLKDIPIIFISAKTGRGLSKIFPQILKLKQQYEKQIATSKLNQAFKRIIESHPLPVHRGKDIKIYYMTQVGVKPPTFLFFANHPRSIHFSYKRYLINALKKTFDLSEIPIRIVFKSRK